MAQTINPLDTWVVATAQETDNKTASGIILPDSAKEKSKVAVVESVGEGVKTVKAGDNILYKEYSTTEVTVDGKDYILVKEEDVLATVK